MAGYLGPNNRRYERKRWIGVAMVSAGLLIAYQFIRGFVIRPRKAD
jgi:hypothetical protein